MNVNLLGHRVFVDAQAKMVYFLLERKTLNIKTERRQCEDESGI